MSIIDDEGVSNPSGNEHFQDIVQACLSRRSFLTGGFTAAAAVSLGGVEALLKAVPAVAQETEEAEDTDAGVGSHGAGVRWSRSKVCRFLLPTRLWCRKGTRRRSLSPGAIPSQTARPSSKTQATPPMIRHVSGACTTTGSSIFRSLDHDVD